MKGCEAWTLGYLVNALWQAPFVFCAAWTIELAARRVGPAMRHKIWVTALLTEAALPACPVRLAQGARALWTGLLTGSPDADGGIQVLFGLGSTNGGNPGRLSSVVVAALMAVYGVSIVYFAVRLAMGLWQTRAMRLRATTLELPNAAGQRLEVRVSRAIAGPVTVGLWHSTVLLPRGFIERVTDEDLRTVLAHEGAHIKRRDFLKNVLYGLAALPIAFHPALWLTRRRIAESREMVCDAMAAEAVAGAERYADSLLRLASLQVERTPNRMLHAIGIFGLFDANSFERRVMHLTADRKEMKGVRRVALAVACGVVGLGTCATALALRIGVPAQSEAVSRPAGGDSQLARVSGGVMAGNVLTKVNPVYPPDAKAEKVTGTVVLSAVIGKDGTVENLQVVSGPEKLRTSALDAVRQWTYKPYLLNGQPTEVQTLIQVTYSLAP